MRYEPDQLDGAGIHKLIEAERCDDCHRNIEAGEVALLLEIPEKDFLCVQCTIDALKGDSQ